ncbi:MAG: hypothetical protein AAGD96_29885, partial [Chloroflexota bacterium]
MPLVAAPHQHIRPSILLFGSFLLLASVFSFIHTPTIEANSVPTACLKDSGEPAEPLPFPGAWAIILNFNHDPSATHTDVCWAVRDDDEAMAITYTDGIRCQIRNNVNQELVGGGEANFDGNFHITCPRRAGGPGGNNQYDSFYVHAVASFPETAGYYPLVRHSDISVRTHLKAPVGNGDWKATMLSQYGNTVFSDTENVSMLSGVNHRINSRVIGGSGTHYVNHQLLASQTNVDPFEFDLNEIMFIGGGDNPWTLSE